MGSDYSSDYSSDYEKNSGLFCFGYAMDSEDRHYTDGYHTKEIIKLWDDCDALSYPSLEEFHTYKISCKHNLVSKVYDIYI